MKQTKILCHKMISTLLLCLVLLLFVFPITVFSAEPIEPERDVDITVSFKDDITPITDARFSIYRVANVSESAHISLTEQFASYPIETEGLDQKGWQELAMTLDGYVKRDHLTPLTIEAIDEKGEVSVTLKPGLYLFLGEKKTIGNYSYSPVPFMLFLPDSNIEDNTWDYEVNIEVKYTKEELPKVVTRRVLKIWDDIGFEEKRPDSVMVQLLRDGEVYDTQVLTEKKQWSHTWENLPEEYEWLVVEKELNGYYTKVSLEGITFTITNKYIVPLTLDNPPIVKKIMGDTPSSPETFTFVFKGEKDNNPMPEGSFGNTKEVSIIGAGSIEIGKITFTEPGKYIYKIAEKDSGAKGYTYDNTVYLLTYTIIQQDDELLISREIIGENGI
ncbi:MAG: Cna B-type domain-containing protein [Lachnospiraceae bacterium]|nr:Cna B-type domain-containing protein [Lachnospiraceae bacterium]